MPTEAVGSVRSRWASPPPQLGGYVKLKVSRHTKASLKVTGLCGWRVQGTQGGWGGLFKGSLCKCTRLGLRVVWLCRLGALSVAMNSSASLVSPLVHRVP